MGISRKLPQTVLVVDDEPHVRVLAIRTLVDAGFVVLGAENAIQALDVLQEPAGETISLVVTDVVMPGMSGVDLGRVLHHLRPALPVLYVSAYSRPDFDVPSPLDLDSCWLQKPYSLSGLVEKARSLCDLTPGVRVRD